MNVTPVSSPLPGERLIATAPVMRPFTDASWRQRLNYWPGRSLVSEAFELEQASRAGRLAWRGRQATSGIVSGLEVALEGLPPGIESGAGFDGHFVHVAPGYGFAASGEDVVVPRPLRVPLDAIPVRYVRLPRTEGYPGGEGAHPNAAPLASDAPQPVLSTGTATFHIDTFPRNHVPWAAVLVLQPAEIGAFARIDPNDPCELDPSRDAYADERRMDAAQLVLCQFPIAWETLPLLTDRDSVTWRNRLAYAIFAAEAADSPRQQLRRLTQQAGGDRWDTVLRDAGLTDAEYAAGYGANPLSMVRATGLFPWEILGVPLALVSSEALPETVRRRVFLDRGAVVRRGGQSRSRSRPTVRHGVNSDALALNPPGAGTPALWRARVDQFAAHIAEIEDSDIGAMASRFRFLPPAGLLPRESLRLLTTQEADTLGATDRASHNTFFPSSFRAEAVPIPFEGLDAALAASAPLSPLDRTADRESVRILVPVSEKSFDPRLLVIEVPDPFFEAETRRLTAIRQDDRQSRDHARRRRDTLQVVSTGPFVPPKAEALEPGQLDPEPVELVDGSGAVLAGNVPTSPLAGPDGVLGTADDLVNHTGIPIRHAWVSPGPEAGTREIIPVVATSRAVDANNPLLLFVRFDPELPPHRVQLVVRSGGEEFTLTWIQRTRDGAPPAGLRWLPEITAPVVVPSIPSDPPSARTSPSQGQLWIGLELGIADLEGVARDITGLSLRVDGGRIALGPIGSLRQRGTSAENLDVWHEAIEAATATFSGPDWTRIHALARLPTRMLAPFESAFEPEFDDGKTLADRLDDLDVQLRLADGKKVRETGLVALVEKLEQEVNKADDAVDLHFLKAQSNAHRARQVIMGEDAANELLSSPVLSSIVESKSARVAQDKLLEAFRAIPDVATRATRTTTALRAKSFSAVGVPVMHSAPLIVSQPSPVAKFEAVSTAPSPTAKFEAVALNPSGSAFRVDTDPVATGGFVAGRNFTAEALPVASFGLKSINVIALDKSFVKKATPAQDNIRAADPLLGQPFSIRTLSFAKRFNSSPAQSAYEFAHAGFLEVLNLIRTLPLSYVSASGADDDVIPDIATGDPNVTDTQRDITFGSFASQPSLSYHFRKIDALPDSDPAALVSRAIRRADASVLILRRLEYYTARRREQLERAKEVLSAVQSQIVAAHARLVALEGELAEARHDVGVARALWQEERQRVEDINVRRDAILRDEVRFVAYVRPRTVDVVARKAPGWTLDHAGALAPVPACLRRHDEPDPALQAYVDLFRNSPARWFTELAPLLPKLDTRERLVEILDAARYSATRFGAASQTYLLAGKGEQAAFTYSGQHRVISQLRQKTAQAFFQPHRSMAWSDFRRDVEEHATVGDLVDGRHGQSEIATEANRTLEQIARVGGCLHAEFAAAPPALRLLWVERYSQFDKPGLLRDMTVLPQFGRLERAHRRRLQELVNWLFGRVSSTDGNAVSLMNDFVRMCLLLASHAPVHQIIAGRIPRPTPVKPGITIPLRPLNPQQVRIGMEFQVWHAQAVVAQGVVRDLNDGEVQARVDHVDTRVTSVTTQMQVRFIAQALSTKTATVRKATLKS